MYEGKIGVILDLSKSYETYQCAIPILALAASNVLPFTINYKYSPGVCYSTNDLWEGSIITIRLFLLIYIDIDMYKTLLGVAVTLSVSL